MIPHLTSTLMLLPLQIANPIDGLTPNFDAFGGGVKAKALLILAGVWGLAILVAIGYLIRGLLAMGRTRDNNPMAHRQATGEAKAAAYSLAGLFALVAIVGAIAWIAS